MKVMGIFQEAPEVASTLGYGFFVWKSRVRIISQYNGNLSQEFRQTFPCSFRTSGATSEVYRHSISKNEMRTASANLVNKFYYSATLEFWPGLTKLLKGNEPRIRIAQYTVTIAVEIIYKGFTVVKRPTLGPLAHF